MKGRQVLVFLFLWVTALAVYFKTAGAGFVTDQVGWLLQYKALGWQGMFNAFDDKSLHYIYHLIGFLLWKLFGMNGTAWMLVFTTLHAGVAFLSFRLFAQLFAAEEIRLAEGSAFTGALLFLLSPYHTEPLVWYACVHYLVCALLLLLSFQFVLKHFSSARRRDIIAFYSCFLPALFTLEISFAFPIILLAFFLFWPAKVLGGVQRWQAIKIFCAPSFVLLVLYFGLSKILRGSVVGHYGAAQHLNFDIALLMANLAKYMSKLFFLSQFYSYEFSQKIYAVFEKAKFGWALFGLLGVFAGLYVALYKKLSSFWQITGLLFSFFIIGLLPILNLYVTTLVPVEGDRFLYFASVFAFQLVAFTCIRIPFKIGWLVIVVALFFNVKFLLVNTQSWANNNQIQQSLIQNYKWYNATHIYILSLPDNFKGTYMYRTFLPDNSFAETLTLYGQPDIENKTTQILSYNMNQLSDSVTVERVSGNELKVTFAQWGNWWWAGGKGGSGYKTDTYEVKIDEWSHSYNIIFGNRPANSVCVYQCSGEWREVTGF